MPDFTVEYHYYCSSSETFDKEVPSSDGKQTYHVRHGHGHKHPQEVQVDWSCTCKAYQHKPGYCKHIEQVRASGEYCGWNQFVDGGSPEDEDNPVCPECRGPVEVMKIAV